METLTKVADLNAFLIQIVRQIELVLEINVLTLVQVLVVRMHTVKLSIIYQHVPVTLVIQEILSNFVMQYRSFQNVGHLLSFRKHNLIFTIAAIEENPCNPSPCGPNSQCRVINQQPVCSCLPEYIGSPPGCRPECTVSVECPLDKACINQKCSDPCPGSCGINANCAVVNHSPICSCEKENTGDPFTRCFPIPRKKFS